MSLLRSLLCAVFAFTTPFAAEAQEADLQHPFATDFAVGITTGRGGQYTNRTGAGFELTFAPGHAGAGFGALTIGARGSISSGDVCAIAPGSTRSCLASYPDFIHVGVLAGLEQDIGPLSLRAMAGPAFYSGPRTSGFGGEAQLDAAVGVQRVALLAAVRGSAIAGFVGEQFTIGALEFGIRIR